MRTPAVTGGLRVAWRSHIDNVHADSDKDVGEMKVYALAVLLALYSSSVAGWHQNNKH